jgi:hypothetical protein
MRTRAFFFGVAAAVAVAAAGTVKADDSALRALTALLSTWTAESRAELERQFSDFNPLFAARTAPLLAALILESRDDALARGVEPVPEAIRAELAGYVPDEVLDRVRWCTDCGGELSLQKNTFRLQRAPAITLGHVIVFERREDALRDAALWVHELMHVMQFDEWGLDGFAQRYIEDYGAVEHEAAEFRWEWVQQTGWLERRHDLLR